MTGGGWACQKNWAVMFHASSRLKNIVIMLYDQTLSVFGEVSWNKVIVPFIMSWQADCEKYWPFPYGSHYVNVINSWHSQTQETPSGSHHLVFVSPHTLTSISPTNGRGWTRGIKQHHKDGPLSLPCPRLPISLTNCFVGGYIQHNFTLL